MRALIGFLLVAAVGAASAAPTVSMTSPGNGDLYLQNLPQQQGGSAAMVFLSASVSGIPPGTSAQVEFFANSGLVQTVTAPPYQYSWLVTAAGSYTVTAKVTDGAGAQATSSPVNIVVSATNTAPTVALTAPADGSRYLAPANVAIGATTAAPEVNQRVQNLEFFLNGVSSNSVAYPSQSFVYTVSGLAAGTYSVTAVATDDSGAQTASTARTFTVSATNAPPAVSLTSPADNTNWSPSGSSMTLQATADSGEVNDSIASVAFYANGTLLGTKTSAPYTLTTLLTMPGSYALTAIATDGQGAQTTSNTRTINVTATNIPPAVSITAPANGASFANPPVPSIAITATADGGEVNDVVRMVEFYVNGTLLGRSFQGPPWTIAWTNVAQGNYSLTAKAFDMSNASTTSAPVSVAVATRQLSFVHADHVGTPREIYNQAQQLVWRSPHAEPFGDSPPDENPSGLGVFKFDLGFAGQVRNRETNTFYNYFRDCYDPALGRYCQFDPIGLRGGINGYVYVGDRPLRYVDPYGLVKWTGTVLSGGAGPSGYEQYILMSECKCNKRVSVTVRARFLSVGLGVPFSYTGQSIEFEDKASCPSKLVFEGAAAKASAGVASGIGFNCGLTQLGSARSADCGFEMGYEGGMSLSLWGESSVVQDSEVPCCEDK